MPAFPDDYTYVDPPGVWQRNTSSSPTALDEDLVQIASANNGLILAGINERPATATELQLVASQVGGGASMRSQAMQAVAGDNVVNLLLGTNVDVTETDGVWSPIFTNVPTGGAFVHLNIRVSNDGDECVIPGVTWHGTAPVTADWDAGETMLLRITLIPFSSIVLGEWVMNIDTPGVDPVTTVPLTAYYTTPEDRVTPNVLDGATLPPGEVYVWFGPVTNPDIESKRLFLNHSGSLPAKGAEGSTYIGERTTPPYDLLGTVLGQPVPWNTNVDPTGNNNEEFDKNDVNFVRDETTWIDGQVTEETHTFTLSNAPIGADDTYQHLKQAYVGATSSHTVTIPDGVDRLVLVVASYNCTPYTGASMIMQSLSIGGNAMTKITAASRDPSIDEGLGQFVAWVGEDDLTTGSMTITNTFSTPPGTWSSVIYDVHIWTNTATPALGGAKDYVNASDVTLSELDPSIASVPANSYLVTVAASTRVDGPAPVVDIGTMSSVTEQPTNNVMETRSSVVEDSGASATETATWDVYGRAAACLIYMDFAASGGGGGVTPIIPGTPSVSLSVDAGNNLIDVTWAATSNAVSYELRHGSTNPIASSPIAGVTSSHRISGLAASTLHYVQVRAKSSTGDYSAWSTIQSATPTGSVTPPPEFSGKYLVSYDHRDVVMGEGFGTWAAPDLWSQRGWSRINPGASLADDSGLYTSIESTMIPRVLNFWESRGPRANAFYNAAGPRMIYTFKLSANDVGMNYTWRTQADRIASVLDMAKTGSKGSYNRDATLARIAQAINRNYTSGSGVTYDGKNIVFVSVGHESNGGWSPFYMGVVSEFIGRPEFNNPNPSVWGSEMAAAIQRIHDIGALDHVHRLACERVIDILWDPSRGGHPNIIVGMTPSAGGQSNPTGAGVGNLTHAWIESGFPRRPLDFVCPTLYNRNAYGVSYDGSGDINDPMNYNRDEGWLETENEFINRVYGCPTGCLELGHAFGIAGELAPGSIPSGTGGVTGDQQAWMFTKRILETSFGPTTGNAENGLAFVQHWNFLRTWSSDDAGPGIPGSTYNILEAHWGRYPTGWTDMSSTAKPSWGVGSGQYPKVLDYYKSQFSAV